MSISTEISRIQTATADIKTAITGKGVTVPTGSQIDDLPALITSIPSGGGSGGDLDALIQRTITEIHSGATSIGASAFRDCATLTTANFPLATSIGSQAFQNCTGLITAAFPSATWMDDYVFRYCNTLTTVDFPLVISIGNYALQGCTALTTADFPLAIWILAGALRSCNKLSTLILRKNAVCTLNNVNALTDTPIASGTGYVYVPASLVDAYKAATNWVTYANQIRAIEDYPEILQEGEL